MHLYTHLYNTLILPKFKAKIGIGDNLIYAPYKCLYKPTPPHSLRQKCLGHKKRDKAPFYALPLFFFLHTPKYVFSHTLRLGHGAYSSLPQTFQSESILSYPLDTLCKIHFLGTFEYIPLEHSHHLPRIS